MGKILITPAAFDDSASLAILADMATRRLASFLWSQTANEGQSPFEVGRAVIRDNPDSLLNHKHWQVAQKDARVLGGLNGYILDERAFGVTAPALAAVLTPLNELKRLAIGSWYISAVAVFPEARGLKIGRSLMQSAETSAKAMSAKEISLMVGSFNPGARRLYEMLGYETRARRDFVSFAGSDRDGHWILMAKSLTEGSE